MPYAASTADHATHPSGTRWLLPSWAVAMPGVGAVMTTRHMPGPVLPTASWQAGEPPYDDINLGDHVGDLPTTVAGHRAALADVLGATPAWLRQVHGHHVARVTLASALASHAEPIEADGSWTTEPGVACTVMVADCLPVLLAAPECRGVAALHAGWRGLAGAGPGMAGQGVLEVGVARLCEGAGCEPKDLQAWLGPCIGPGAFEVGEDVLRGFGVDPAEPHPRFVRQRRAVASPASRGGSGVGHDSAEDMRAADDVPAKWLGNLSGLAGDRLRGLGVQRLTGGEWCTVSDPSRFFSFRREGITGRQAACIWIRP